MKYYCKPISPTARLLADSRSVSKLVGFILLFGIVIVLLSVHQAFVVPSANEEVEFRHSQPVQKDIQILRNSVIETVATGTR